ncbi:MAG: Gfo/Idh/MocA family oxidoreductase [Bryobacterales bacterium]|nr:Gfo/Idh/MocA family oxidoreductase [Bryobacterales bacterium]
MKTTTGLVRRDFLQAAGVASLAGGSPAQSSLNRIPGANDRIRLGLIGCGGMGNADALAFLKVPNVEFAALCDIDQNRLRETAARTGGKPDTYGDFRRIIERTDIDAVVIATPDHWHAIPALQALRAGKDVYLEKPLAHTIAEGQLLVKTVRDTNRILQVGLQQRSGSIFLEAAEVIRSGKIGKVSMVHCFNVWNQSPDGISKVGKRTKGLGRPPDSDPPEGVDYDFWLGPAPKRQFNPVRFHWNYIYFWDYSGGMLLIWMVHLLDSVFQALGLKAPNSVHTGGGIHVLDDMRETPDTAVATLEFDNLSVICSCLHATSYTFGGRRFDHGIQVIGTAGTLLIDRSGYQVIAETQEAEPIPSPAGLVEGYGVHQQKFIECLRNRTRPPCDVVDGHLSTTALHLANISYRTGRKIYWDEAREQIINDPEANAFLSKEYRKPWSLHG